MPRNLLSRLLPLLVLAILAGAWGIGARTPALAAGVFAVTKQDDTADGSCDSDCSLREAIIAANADDDPSTIVVPASANHYLITTAAGDDASAQGDFDINTQITIEGAGADQTIIDGGAADTVFHVGRHGKLTLSGATVENGKAMYGSLGGGIFAEGPLTLDSVTVSGNSGGDERGAAGGIYADAPLQITHSEISGNTAGDEGAGGIFADWDTKISHSAINGNTAAGVSSVGGFYFDDTGELTNVTISGNQASGENSTGGLYTFFSDDISLSRVTISGNTATGSYAIGGWWNAAHVKAQDVVIDNNHGGQYGEGGLYVQCCDGKLDLNDATVSNNTAPDDSGGGVWNEGESTLTNVTVSGNGAGAAGAGGIYNGSDLTLVNVTIANNTAGDLGEGGLWNDDMLTSRNTLVAENQGGDCFNDATVASEGGNFSLQGDCTFDRPDDHPNTYPLLAALADNGGFSQTQALKTGSPAINAGVGCPQPGTDQRGVTRPAGACDSGAFEVGVFVTAERMWGDILCNGSLGGDDAIAILALANKGHESVPAGGACPEPDKDIYVGGWFNSHAWGDVNCDGDVNALDALAVLLAAAGLPSNAASCPAIGQTVPVA